MLQAETVAIVNRPRRRILGGRPEINDDAARACHINMRDANTYTPSGGIQHRHREIGIPKNTRRMSRETSPLRTCDDKLRESRTVEQAVNDGMAFCKV